jgi:type IV secretion system protein VirB6
MIYKPFLNICLILMLFFAPYHNTNNAWAAFKFNHSCIPAPDFTEFDKTNKTINVGDNLGKWQSAGKSLSNGDSIKFAWNADDIYVPPKKYMVLYRLDPRFERPQVFIKSWNYATKQWDSDFDSFIGKCGPGSLTMYQKNPAPLPTSGNNNVVYTKCDPNSPDVNTPKYTLLQQFTDYINYFNFVGRSPITVNSGDVINIQAVPASSFFDAGPNFTTNYDINSFSGKKPIHYIYTDVGGLSDGLAIFGRAQAWAPYLTSQNLVPNDNYNFGVDENGQSWFSYKTLNVTPAFGMANNSTEGAALNNILTHYWEVPIGIYVHCFGIDINGNFLKGVSQPYNTNNGIANGFFYAIAQNSGALNFMSPYFPMGTVAWGNPMFRNVITQMPGINMKTWRPASGSDFTYDDLYQIQNNIQTSDISYVEIYREVLSIEIGGNTIALQNNVGVEYMISPTSPPDGTSGTMVAANDTIYAGSNGSLWIRAVNNDPSYSVSGNLNVYMATYNGSTDISDFVYDDVVNPILTKLNDLTFTLYHGLISNLTFRNIAMSLLTLYIMLYGIYYLAGATNITTYDLVARVVKITIITTLFSPGSWAFFNDHFFTAFINGTSYLIYNIIGTNTHQNIFGFLDVVFNKFTNPDLWGNLLVQFVNFQTALPFFALLVIIGLLKYFLTLLEVVVAYLMAFVTVAVLISLAPFFITFMLFGRTKNLFNNWISALFNAAIYPTILLIFYLLLDDIVTGLLENVAVESCWDTLLPIKFSFTLKPLLDWSPTFSIPGFPGIGFWVPASDAGGIVGQQGSYFTIMTSSIIFFCYANAASGLLGFVTGIVGSLARVGDSAAGVVPSQSMKSILSDVTVAKRMAGNLGARAAIAAYDHGPGVARAAIKVGSYGLNAAASTAYHAPKNIAKGLGYAAGKTVVAAKAIGTREGRTALGAALNSKVSRASKATNAAITSAGNKAAAALTKAGKPAYDAMGNIAQGFNKNAQSLSEGFDQTKADAAKFTTKAKFALSKEGREARDIAKKTKAANAATQKYRDHAKKLEENKALSLAKAQEKVANKKAREKFRQDVYDGTIGAAGRGLEATGNAIKGTFGEEARNNRKAAREAAKATANHKKAHLETQKYRDHAKKLEDNKAKALAKAQAKEARKIEREKFRQDVYDGTIGAAGRGLEATGNAIKGAFGEEARDKRKAAREEAKAARKIEREKKWNEFKDSAKGAYDATGEAIEGTFGKEARDKRKAAREEAKAARKIEREKKWNEFKDSAKGAYDATGEAIEGTFGEEARDGRKAARQKFKGDLGDKLLHGVKDVGNAALKPINKAGDKLAGAGNVIYDTPSEIGRAASLVGRKVADKTHGILEKGRDLGNKVVHTGVILDSAFKEGYDKGQAVKPAEFEQNQKAREEKIEKVTTDRSEAKTAKQQERADLFEERKTKDDAIAAKRTERDNKKQARIDKTKEQEKQREQDRSKKKDIRDKAIDRKIERDRQDKEREKNNKDKSPAEKLREYKEVSEQRKKEDIADARSIAVKYGKKKK